MKMNRLVFRGLIGAVMLLAAALLGAWAAVHFYRTPLCDLRGISFPYAVAEKDGMPVVKVFFVTNRKQESAEKAAFGDTQGDALVYGTAQVRIPPGLNIGDVQKPEIPRAENDGQLATIERVDVLSEKEFYADLSKWIEDTGAKMVNLLVHGVNHSFDSSIRQAGALSFDLNMPQPMVLFSWPTAGGILPGDYAHDAGMVASAAKGLQNFLDGFQAAIHLRRINIVAHSMGANVVCETFVGLVKDEKWHAEETVMANVILAAPDVDKDDFDQRFIHAVARLAGRVTVYVANNDGVLMLSGFLNGVARAGGRSGHKALPPEIKNLVTEDVNDLPQIEVIDATFVNNTATTHSYYYQSRPVFSDLYALLQNDIGAKDRHLLHHENAEKANYWIIAP